MGEPVSAQMKIILALEQKEIKEVTDRTMIEVGDEAVEKLKATSPKRTKYKKKQKLTNVGLQRMITLPYFGGMFKKGKKACKSYILCLQKRFAEGILSLALK